MQPSTQSLDTALRPGVVGGTEVEGNPQPPAKVLSHLGGELAAWVAPDGEGQTEEEEELEQLACHAKRFLGRQGEGDQELGSPVNEHQ